MDRNTKYIAKLRTIPGRRYGATFRELYWKDGIPYIGAFVDISGMEGVLFHGYPTLTETHWTHALVELKKLHFHWLQYENPLIHWVSQWEPHYGGEVRQSEFDIYTDERRVTRLELSAISKLPTTPIDFDCGLSWLNSLQKRATDEQLEDSEELGRINEGHRIRPVINDLEQEIAKLKREVARLKGEPKQKRPERDRYVYVIKDRANGLYKIGKSFHPNRREKTLQSERPVINLVFKAKCSEAFNENDLHARFAQHRVRGEWFALTSAQVRYICHIGRRATT